MKRTKRGYMLGGILAACSVLFTVPTMAQKGAIMVAATGGVSINSNPTDNMVYKGDQVTLNHAATLSGVYNFHRSMDFGIEVRTAQLSRISDSSYYTYLKTTIGGDGKRFVYAKNAISVNAIFNGKLNMNRGYLYVGPAVGYAITRHNSSVLNTGTETYRAPDGGRGVVLGAQAGFVYGLGKIVGINIEAALRHHMLSYDAGAPDVVPYTDLKYNITSYGITTGLKFRILPKERVQNAIPAMRGKGRSKANRPPRKPRRR